MNEYLAWTGLGLKQDLSCEILGINCLSDSKALVRSERVTEVKIGVVAFLVMTPFWRKSVISTLNKHAIHFTWEFCVIV
jgi:hypothetical protein